MSSADDRSWSADDVRAVIEAHSGRSPADDDTESLHRYQALAAWWIANRGKPGCMHMPARAGIAILHGLLVTKGSLAPSNAFEELAEMCRDASDEGIGVATEAFEVMHRAVNATTLLDLSDEDEGDEACMYRAFHRYPMPSFNEGCLFITACRAGVAQLNSVLDTRFHAGMNVAEQMMVEAVRRGRLDVAEALLCTGIPILVWDTKTVYQFRHRSMHPRTASS